MRNIIEHRYDPWADENRFEAEPPRMPGKRGRDKQPRKRRSVPAELSAIREARRRANREYFESFTGQQ